MKTSIILVAAGKGERFGQPKWQVRLAGKTLLEWCLETIAKPEFEKEVIVVGSFAPSDPLTPFLLRSPSRSHSSFEGRVKGGTDSSAHSLKSVQGGNNRHESVQIGLRESTGDLVIIHNVANPLASAEDFMKIHDLLIKQDAACFVGQRNVDTLRRVLDGSSDTIDRSDVWRVQTPQGFRRESLLKVVEENMSPDPTDEVSLFEGSEVPVVAIETSALNQKITYPQDLEMLEQCLKKEVLMGIGEDSHFFDTSGTMVIGGVKVEGLPKLQANSDGDLILHALFNAISSALGKRSLGISADPMAEQGIIDSSEYLKVILKEVHDRGFVLNNLSISLECSQPKIEPLSISIKNSLSQLLTINPHQIGITATSGEGLSSFGKGEGIRCSCVVTLTRFLTSARRNK